MSTKPARWWYDRPAKGWDAGDLLLPCVKYYKCGDGFCNDTLFVRVPLLGHFTFRLNRKIRIDNRCERCIAEHGPWCHGCQGCHRGPRCHEWLECEHRTRLAQCPACGGDYCRPCEPEPNVTCPYRGNLT